ncbi:NAD(P)/FAD-dependent oxidoreductase [Desulfosoma caldarium]|uniref:Thioredoxin reductase (NADPH) n=1 Tax=Desulfosoma caldarium TaxID=610254 RepID=A0A3N1VJH9_9BACT|nr:FAD-dependent oxidoreductase [Desulfosoma caldarium]ROR02953.1 thioredoxin reductase (NADPH) [Desulfosoma caldarium]
MKKHSCDVAILGTGPAGLQAAIHAARKKVSVAVVGKVTKSSAYRAHVENFCCIPHATGEDLLAQGRHQAEKFGAVFFDQDVVQARRVDGHFELDLEGGDRIEAKALILAMGISRKKLGVPGERELLGKGVSYCVECDANFFRGAPVAVVGCESAAVSGALTLLFYTDHVHLICEALQVADNLVEKLRHSAVKLHEGRKVLEIVGSSAVEAVVLDDGTRIPVQGVFIERGAKGALEIATALGVSLDTESFQYVVTNKKQETNIPGVYAAGDICGPPWQIAKAVGEGCVAGLEAADFVRKLS